MNTTEQSNVCATANVKTEWHRIDWSQTHKNVRKLQARIVKAIQESRWNKAKALQHLLTHSFSGKALAVKRVTENQGKNTSGVDGITWSSPSAKSAAVDSLRSHGYKPKPLKRVYIPKSNGTLRPLGIPTMKDRAMQALYLSALDPISECISDGHSYGFRKERSTHDAIQQCWIITATKWGSPEWVLEGDIKGCFDNISHDWLMANVPMDKTILRKWLKAGYMEKNAWFQTETGTPQGGIISPLLANLALNGLQELLSKTFPKRRLYPNGGNKPPKRLNNWLNLVRYADDFIITCESRKQLEQEIVPVVAQFLAARGLELSQMKTKVTHIDEGYDFLGQNVRRYSKKILIKPAKKNVKAFLRKIREVIYELRSQPQHKVIKRLNPMIKGWAEYHKHIVASKTFSNVDSQIWLALWKWCKRRHRNKAANWIKNQYFSGNWDYSAQERDPRTGKSRLLKLRRASDIKIQRHIKIRSAANPYDPKDEEYFESRIRLRMLQSLAGRRKLLSVWSLQNGLCLNCNEPLTKESGWHLHHLEERHKGGSDNPSNLVMLHVNCHKQVHANGKKLKKPVRRQRRI